MLACMAWNGTHPVIERWRARMYLPPGACKLCVYRFRLVPGNRLLSKRFAGLRCGNCDIQWPNPLDGVSLPYHIVAAQLWSRT